MRSVAIIAVSLGAAALAGCAQHTWAPGPGATMAFSQASGICKLAAINGQTSGYVAAAGSPRFVAAAAGAGILATALGNAIRQQNIYNACMEANGFVVADVPAGTVTPIGTQTPVVTPMPIGSRIPDTQDPEVSCQLTDSEPMMMSHSSCLGRGGTATSQ